MFQIDRSRSASPLRRQPSRSKRDALLNRISLADAAKFLGISRLALWVLVTHQKLFTVIHDESKYGAKRKTKRKKIYLVPAEVKAFKTGGAEGLATYRANAAKGAK